MPVFKLTKSMAVQSAYRSWHAITGIYQSEWGST